MIRKLNLPDSAAPSDDLGGRRLAPSAERNAAPIFEKLRQVAPIKGRMLEIASGTGQHAAAFAQALPGIEWQPSDIDPGNFPTIEAWTQEVPNVLSPIQINAGLAGWEKAHSGYDLVMAVNLLHLISNEEARAVVSGMSGVLVPGGQALIYGPFRRNGQLTSEGDHNFDASLRAQDPEIGYKDISQVKEWAVLANLQPEECAEMPANNLCLVCRRLA